MNALVSGIYQRFPALSHKHFRRFFFAQLVSLVGTWMQQAAIPWLVEYQTGSAYMVGLVIALSSLPILLFTVPAGVFADRRPKRTILVYTQIFLLVNAALFALFSAVGALSIAVIIALSIMRGLLMSFDIPVRQSFFREMVGRESLPSAIAVNSGMFNAARIVGPALAGLFLAVGPTICFLLNAVSFVGVIIVLFRMKPVAAAALDSKSGWHSLVDGFRYVRSNPGIRAIFFLLAVCSIFGWSYMTLLPTMSHWIYHAPPYGYGLLLSSCGVGALIGAATVGRMRDARNLPKFVIGGWLVFIAALTGFGCSASYFAGMFAIFGIGLGLTTLHVAQNSLVQTLVSDRYRGRVMGLYMFLWAGLGTFGSYVVGQMAEMLHGVSATLAINAAICLGAVLLVRSRIMAAGRQIAPHAHAPAGVAEQTVEAPEVLPLRSASPPAITLEQQDAS